MPEISPSQEDYLESIIEIGGLGGGARVSDIAAHRNVSMPSVTGAMKRLEKQGLVRHDRSNAIALTPAGRKIALRTANRHALFKHLLVGVLDIDEPVAERDACAIEHLVSDKTVVALSAYLDELAECDEIPCRGHRRGRGRGRTRVLEQMLTLDEVEPGRTVRVVGIMGCGGLRRRLIEMGVVCGAEVSVQRAAPFGDPLEIRIKGASVSLRKKEAATIAVEPVEGGA